LRSRKNKKGGFEYYLEEEKIKEYSKWSPEDKLKWLSEWNRLRKYYPLSVIKKQERLRKGEI